jgi:hypothetical protein
MLTIISGGQTGADRAALDFAIERGLPHGGWCPKGRLALDGVIDAKYLLNETPSSGYPQRTEWNVRDSDATVVCTLGPKPTGGSLKTISIAVKHGKPCLHLQKGTPGAAEILASFIREHHVRRLNVAGSRESKEPGIYEWVRSVLESWNATGL